MTHARARCLVVLVLVIVALPLFARPARAARQAPAPPAVVPPTVVTDSQDAQQTRKALDELLKRYPPTLGRVLKLDPMLLENPAYLSPYPGLAAYLAQHPEIGPESAVLLANVDAGDYYSTPPDRETEAIRMWQRMMAGLVAFMVFIIVTATLAWLIKTLIDYRRWHRLSKVQAEVHTKLLDRFSANEDLLAYTPVPCRPQVPRVGPDRARRGRADDRGSVAAHSLGCRGGPGPGRRRNRADIRQRPRRRGRPRAALRHRRAGGVAGSRVRPVGDCVVLPVEAPWTVRARSGRKR